MPRNPDASPEDIQAVVSGLNKLAYAFLQLGADARAVAVMVQNDATITDEVTFMNATKIPDAVRGHLDQFESLFNSVIDCLKPTEENEDADA